MRRSFRREHGVHQGEAVLVHHLDGNAQLPAQTLHGVVVQKHGLAVAHHVDGDQHPIPQVPSPQLGGDILPGKQARHVDGVAEEVVFHGDDLPRSPG